MVVVSRTVSMTVMVAGTMTMMMTVTNVSMMHTASSMAMMRRIKDRIMFSVVEHNMNISNVSPRLAMNMRAHWMMVPMRGGAHVLDIISELCSTRLANMKRGSVVV